MERRKCRRCGHPMTRMFTNDAGQWSACYPCLRCGYATAAVTAKTETAAEDGLERFMDRVDRAHETSAGRSAAPRKPGRLLKVYDLYCQLCETLTGEINPEPDVLRDALQKAKRELEAYKGAGLRYEEEIARLKRMAAEDILLAAQSRCPCNSCTENPIDKGCTFEECEGCDHRCVCYECNDDESFVWRGGK